MEEKGTYLFQFSKKCFKASVLYNKVYMFYDGVVRKGVL